MRDRVGETRKRPPGADPIDLPGGCTRGPEGSTGHGRPATGDEPVRAGLHNPSQGPDGDDGPTLITHSEIATWRSCPKKWWFAYQAGGYGIRPCCPSINQSIGSAYHRGMEAVVVGEDPTVSVEGWIAEHELDLGDTDIKVRVHALGLCQAHAKKWKTAGVTTVRAEETFIVPLKPKDSFALTGQIDAIVDKDGACWIMEHKTTSRLDGDYLAMIPRDAQILRYTKAARWLGYPIVGVIYTIAIKSALRERQNEGPEGLLKRVKKDYEERGADAIHWEIVRFGEDDISRCASGTRETIQAMLADTHRTRYEENCRTKYGLCPYFECCLKQPWDGRGHEPFGFVRKARRHEELAEETE